MEEDDLQKETEDFYEDVIHRLSIDSLRDVCVFFYNKDEERQNGLVHKTTDEEKIAWIESCVLWMEQYKDHGNDHSELTELMYKYEILTNDDRLLLTEYEITHPIYTFNGTWSPAREYEWEKTEVPSVTPSTSPSQKPTKKKKPTPKPTPKKKKVTRKPTHKPSKKPTKRRRPPNKYPTDSPNGIGGGGYGSFLCHDGCFQFAGDGVCDDGGPGASYFICMYGRYVFILFVKQKLILF